WTSLDRKEWFAGVAIEDVEEARFVALDDNRHRASIAHQRREQRRRRRVVVPEIVMDQLEAPRDLARRRAQRDDRVRPFVVAGALTAEVVGARTAGRHEHEM